MHNIKPVNNIPYLEEILKQPKLMDDVRWLLIECQKRQLL